MRNHERFTVIPVNDTVNEVSSHLSFRMRNYKRFTVISVNDIVNEVSSHLSFPGTRNQTSNSTKIGNIQYRASCVIPRASK